MTDVMAAAAVKNSTAINVHVYKNGDPFFRPKKCVVNPRKVDFDMFLNEVTRLVRISGGAVRNIYTPTQGHRIKEVQDLVNNQYYVAAGKETFKRNQYASGGVRMIRRPPRQGKIRPVAHSRIQVSAKCRKTQEGPKVIHVYRNRDDKSLPVKLLLDKRHRANMDTVYDYVNLKVNLISGQAVQRLYNLNGSQIMDESEIEAGGHYVAAARERFSKVGYGNSDAMSPRGGKNGTFVFGRVPSNTRYGLKPITLPKVRTAVKASPRPPPQSNRRPAAKPTPKPPARRQLVQKRKPPEKPTPPKKEAEGVMLMKPTMVKRSREKEDKASLDYSDDPNSVFKAKAQRDEVQGASEVQETKDTVTELPIDQVAAEEVEEEEHLGEDVAPKEEEDKKEEAEVVEEELSVAKEEEEQENLSTNQNNNSQDNRDSPQVTKDRAPVTSEKDDPKLSTPSPATPGPKTPTPSPPQDRPKSSQSPAFITDEPKPPSPENISSDTPSPDFELPKSPTLSPPSQEAPKQNTVVPQLSESPQRISPSVNAPSERSSASASIRSLSAPPGKFEDTKAASLNHTNSLDTKETKTAEFPEAEEDAEKDTESPPQVSPQENLDDGKSAEIPEDIPGGEEVGENPDVNSNQDLNEDTDKNNPSTKTPSPTEDKTRTPSPPKTPKTPSRTRSVTPTGHQSPSPKEQIGNGHAHTAEEVNA